VTKSQKQLDIVIKAQYNAFKSQETDLL